MEKLDHDSHAPYIPKVAVKWVIHLLRIQEDPVSNIGSEAVWLG
jgi:hypothetical protein